VPNRFGSTVVRVWAAPELISQGAVALEAGLDILPYFEEFYGVGFPLPKQDMVAIPDFAAGAMENWGLITYRSTALLYDAVESSAANEQRVAIVVAHELAHQWSGDLVTPIVWDELWLNEGFASYVEYVGVDHLHPSWNMFGQFVQTTQQAALLADSSLNSHPVLQVVSNPAEINSLFDALSYSKGAALISMVMGIITEDVFRAGLTRYLEKFAYGNADSDDLWAALDAAALADGQDVKLAEIMPGWTDKMGYPYVSLELAEGGGGGYVAKQRRFLLSAQADPTPLEAAYKWDIELSFVRERGNTVPTEQWLRPALDSVNVEYDAATHGWIKGNFEQTGFYRVNYPDAQWQLLERAILSGAAGTLSVSDRCGLLDDAFSFARAGIDTIDQAFNMSRILRVETTYPVWSSGLSQLMHLDYLLRFDADYSEFTTYMSTLLLPRLLQVGWQDSGDHSMKLLRSTILAASLHFDVRSSDTDTASSNATHLFARFMADPVLNIIPADLRDAVYDSGVARGGQAQWDFLFARYQTTQVASEARRCLHAMATRKLFLCQSMLLWMTSSDCTTASAPEPTSRPLKNCCTSSYLRCV
jgi:aminopeptidase N